MATDSDLSRLERLHLAIARRMNRDPWKRMSSFFSRNINGRGILALLGDNLHVDGWEYVRAMSPDRPILVVANHRTFFDLFVVTALLLVRLGRPIRIYFPVRARYFYQTVGGMLLNAIGAHWSMYPPIFMGGSELDRGALDELIGLCREGPGHVIGIHPEGTRNRNPDPYSLGKVQPGAGRIILAARPQVVPVFVAGISNHMWSVIRDARRRVNPVRVRFGPLLDLSQFDGLPMKGSSYKTVTDAVMERVRELGEADRQAYATSAPPGGARSLRPDEGDSGSAA